MKKSLLIFSILLLLGTLTSSLSQITFTGPELLGRPTNSSIVINVVPDAAIELYYEYGTTKGGPYPSQTSPSTATAGQPHETIINGLSANTRYYYRMQYRTSGGSWLSRDEHTFHTQRTAGSTFTFTVTSDAHAQFGANLQQAMQNIKSDQPDFELDLGDIFMLDSKTTQTAVNDAYLAYRSTTYFGAFGHSAPIFLSSGNHENEEGWNLDDTFSIGQASIQARKLYYPTPITDGFYTGNTDVLAAIDAGTYGDQYREDYYAWTWGDALFVVIDPFQYTMTNPYGSTAGEGSDDPASGDQWNWTLGQQQFNWLKQTLQNSSAKFKFVFSHQVVGGQLSGGGTSGPASYVRGGAMAAPYFEWGGKNADESWGFSTKRPGFGDDPIHQLFIDNGVSAYFHGHDHQFVHEERDGVVYQLVPSPSMTGYGFDLYDSSPYVMTSNDVLGNLPGSGHLRLTVTPSQTTVDYVRSSTTGVSYTYTILPNTPVTTYDLTMAADPSGGGTTTPAVGAHSYAENAIVNVSAAPATGYTFDHWSGDLSGSSNPTTITMNGAKSVTAHFVTAPTFNLTMAVSPSGSGSTTPAVGVHSYNQNTVVTITAIPAAGYKFDHWSGDVADVNSISTTVTMDAAQSVTAYFVESTLSYLGDIGSNTIKNSSVADLVITTTAAVAGGDAIIIAYATDPSQDLNLTVSDAAGNKYQQAAMAIMVGSLRTYIFAAYNVTALPSGSTITITQTVYSSTTIAARAAVASVFRGLAPSGALEQSCVSSGTSATPSSGAATTVQMDQLLIGAVGTEGPATDAAGTWSNSFTAGPRAGTTATTTDAEITVSMGWRIVSSAGSYTAAKAGITSRDWAAAIASFKTMDAGISYIANIGASQSKTAGTTLTVTTTAPVTAGDDILLTFATDPAGTVSSVSDGVNTYNQVIDVTNTGNVRTMIYAAYNVTALPSAATITITHTSVTARSAVVSVFRGLANSAVVDQTKTATGSTNAVSSGATGTTTQADELLIGAVGLEGPNVDAPSVWQNSFSFGPRLGTSFGSSSGGDTDITSQMGWRIVSATASYTAQLVNLNTTRDWAAAIATFKSGPSTPTYSLNVTTDGNGSVNLNPSGGNYASGTTVTLTPVPNSGFHFDSWIGANADDIINTSGVYTIVMTGDKSVTANFIASGTKRGDVNGDEAANSTDALIVLSCDVGIDVSAYCPMNCGDVNEDGLVNSTDALIILSYDVGMSVPFPVGQTGCPTSVTPCPGCN